MASEKGVRTLGFFMVIMFTFFCKNVLAIFNTAENYAYDNIFNTQDSGVIMGGLDLKQGNLYFASDEEIKSFNLQSKTAVTMGAIGTNNGVSLVVYNQGLVYTAFSTSFNYPYPYKMGYLNTQGIYVNQLDEDGIYDAAVNSLGEFYISANPDALGSKIFKYDWLTGSITEVADIGGPSGGLVFDSQDNLYYADQGIYGQRSGSIVKFSAEQISGGGLFFDDAQSVIDVTAGCLAFDESGLLYASRNWGAALTKYDINSGSYIEDIAFASNNEWILKVVLDGDSLYALSTDYSNYCSNIYQITIPEPATLTFLSLAGLGLRSRRV